MENPRLKFGRVPVKKVVVYDESSLQKTSPAPQEVDQADFAAATTVVESMLHALQRGISYKEPLMNAVDQKRVGAGNCGPDELHLAPYDVQRLLDLNLECELIVPAHRVTHRVVPHAPPESHQYYYKRMTAREFFNL